LGTMGLLFLVIITYQANLRRIGKNGQPLGMEF